MRPRGTAIARVLAVSGAILAVAATDAQASSPPTVSVSAPSSLTTTGALVDVSVDPGGVDTLYQVNYGPSCSQLTQSTGYMDAGSGTGAVEEPTALSQLSPDTSYCYEAEVFQNGTQADVTTPTQTLTTTPNPSGPGTPIVTPQQPPANGFFSGNCDTDVRCLNDMNGVRAAQEGLPPLSLPTNWTSLTPKEQMFVAVNMERVSRGLSAIPVLVNTYDAQVTLGMQNDNDPDLSSVQTDWSSESIWAGGNATVLGAMYGWLYQDGYGVGNLDCTTPTAPGCWGHREAILDNPNGSLNPVEMDAIVGTDNNGAPSYAAAFTTNTQTPAANILFTWAQEQPFLTTPAGGSGSASGSGPGSGASGSGSGGGTAGSGAGGPSPGPVDSGLGLSRGRFQALGIPHAPSLLPPDRDPRFGTIVSYSDAGAATTTLTILRLLPGIRTHGGCVARPRHHHGHVRSCTREVVVGSISHADQAGPNRVRFTGRVNGHPLRAGRYLLEIAAADASGHLPARRAFTITG